MAAPRGCEGLPTLGDQSQVEDAAKVKRPIGAPPWTTGPYAMPDPRSRDMGSSPQTANPDSSRASRARLDFTTFHGFHEMSQVVVGSRLTNY